MPFHSGSISLQINNKPLSTIFQLYRGSRFIGGGAENHRPEKIHTGTNIQVDYT
jgi:hypothetical protein